MYIQRVYATNNKGHAKNVYMENDNNLNSHMRHNFKRRSVLLFCALLLSSFSFISISASLTGNWIYHSAAALNENAIFSQVHRIIDGNRYVYFLVRGCTHNRGNNYTYCTENDIDPIQVFRYDKRQPWDISNVKSLISDETSGFIPAVAEYDPRLGLLVLIYEDNQMDLIFDDGRIINSQALRNNTKPDNKLVPYSVTFDLDEDAFYVATSHGYQKVDAGTGENICVANFDKKVSWAARIGGKMVLIAGDTVNASSYSTNTYYFDVDDIPASLGGHELKLTSMISGINMSPNLTLPNLQGIMPVSDDTFIVFASLSSDKECPIIKIKLADSGNIGTLLVEKCSFDDASAERYRHLFKTDGRYSRLTDGYMVGDRQNVYIFRNENGDVALETIFKGGFTNPELGAKMASIDGKTFWFHLHDYSVPGRGFYYRNYDGGWKPASDVIWPNSPNSMYAPDMAWSPKYGMLFRGPGSYFNPALTDADFFFSYKDGVWKDLSYHNYREKNNYWDITESQRTICIDPINEDMVWSSGMTTGMLRMDLSDYDNFFMIGPQQRTAYTSSPGYFNLFPNQKYYNNGCNFSNFDFDQNNTMWFSHDEIFSFSYDFKYYTEGYVPLMYLTAEERKSMEHIGSDASKVIMPHVIKIYSKHTDRKDQIIAMKTPGYGNILLHTPRGYNVSWKSCFIYDHNGTLEDLEDDRMAPVTDLYDETGVPFGANHENWIYEDTYRGDIWLCTNKGVVIFNPKEYLDGNKSVRRPHINKREGADVDEYPLDMVCVNQVADDILGRKWLAAETGLYVLSRDSKELLAHFSTENSGLPDNQVLGVGCDLGTGSVFAVTHKGLVEFQPSDSYNSLITEPALTIWPQTIGPDFRGYVNITGADPSSTYVVSDAEGQIVKTLGKPVNGTIQWDLTNTSSQAVESGNYNVHRTGNSTETNRIKVIR